MKVEDFRDRRIVARAYWPRLVQTLGKDAGAVKQLLIEIDRTAGQPFAA